MRLIEWKKMTVLLIAAILTVGLCAMPFLSASAAPDAGGRVPYVFNLEEFHTSKKGSISTQLAVFREMELALGQSIEATGWLATAEGVSAYQYLWLPAGGGAAEWTTLRDVKIYARNDLTSGGIQYPSGHGSAGFRFSIAPPPDAMEGYYDIYIRALDGMGTPCDVAAILSLRYGEPDYVTDESHVISLPRIGREGDASLFGGATVEEDAIRLPPDGGVKLGDLDLSAFECVRITYSISEPEAIDGERTPILGLKSEGKYSYGKESEAYNTTHSLVYAPVRTGEVQMTMDLSACNHNGEVWLTGHLSGEVIVTDIKFIANGYGSDRVAARINLSSAVTDYFNSINRVDLLPVSDPTLGDVLRIEVNASTNDPFAHFRAGMLLKEQDIILDADEYKYVVLLIRSFKTNTHGRLGFYLCAGNITTATEDCTHYFSVRRDGEWHYYLMDLSKTENWTGVINGMRFDIFSGDCVKGEALEFASMQFFRTREAALAAVARDPADRGLYSMENDPILIRDMSEEGDPEEVFTIDPADTYEVTEPATEPVPRPETRPEVTEVLDDTAEDTQSVKKGCGATVTFGLTAALVAAAAMAIRRKD